MNRCIWNPYKYKEWLMATQRGKTSLKVNGIYTKFVPINKLKHNLLNAKVYGDSYLDDNAEYIQTLSESIREHGLDHALEVCSDGFTLIGGHHRLDAMTGAGYTEIPVIVTEFEAGDFESPASRLAMMNMLVRNNMQNTYTQYQRWNQAERWCEVYEAKYGKQPKEKTYNKEFGKSIGFTWTPLAYARDLVDGYPFNKPTDPPNKDYAGLPATIYVPPRTDLLDNVKGIKGRKSRSFKNAHDTQFNDAINKAKQLNNKERVKHNQLPIDRAVRLAVEEASKWVRDLLDYKTEFCGQEVRLGYDQDVNTMSAMLHGGVTKLLPAALEAELGIESIAPDGGSHFDVIAKPQKKTGGYEWQLEVKCNAGKKENWSSGTDKIGYNLLIRADNTFTEFFVAYVYVPEKYPTITRDKFGKAITPKDCWTGGGALKTKKLSKGCLSTLINGMDVKFPKRFDISAKKLRDDEWFDEFPVHGRCILGNIKETTNGVTRKIDIQLESIIGKGSENEKSNEVTNTFSIQQAV